jgi:hypothetical protein
MQIIATVYTRKIIARPTVVLRDGALDIEQRGQYAAGADIAQIGKDVDGLFYLVTCDGERFGEGYPVALRAKLAARRHFGPDVITV